ncbi:MAG TPA: NeuD/PglB/VioB family sugar acetyltransferase [Terrimesophilobacter sp.]|nr:NeuD/PglB/VioB family sugar acetyltransferase [Terrimesophilobacter sp.]
MSWSALVLGNGGHSKVVIDLLLGQGIEVAATISLSAAEPYRGVPALVGEDRLRDFSTSGHRCVVAIGDNAARMRAADSVRQAGFAVAGVVGAGAIVSPTVAIGDGTVIMNGAVVNADARIGALCILNTGATVDHDCVIGDGVHLAPGSHLAGGVTIGAGSFLGVGVSVIPGIAIGEGVVVGAGGVVVTDIESGSRVAGVPARPIRTGG